MQEPDIGQFVYLVLLGTVIAGYFFVQNRNRLGQMAQQAILWSFLFAGAITLYGFKDQLQRQLFPRQAVQTEVGRLAIPRATDRHFYVALEINGQAIDFVIDTGATEVVLSQNDAGKIGINPEDLIYTGYASTANGEVRTARVKLETVSLGQYTDKNLTAWVNDGEMDISLLGMAYLSRFSSLEITGDTLFLTR